MTADGQRIASLERQVAGLSARVEQLARQAFVIKTLEEIAVERAGYGSTRGTSSVLQAAFDAGWASAGQDTAPRSPIRRLRHLHAVEARHA
jgi:hypothetical protein